MYIFQSFTKKLKQQLRSFMQQSLQKVSEAQIRKQLLIQNEQITTKQTIQVYKEALAFSNLVFEHQLHTRNVKIYEKDHVHEIYTNSHPKENLPHLVMLHGFGGTALTFIRTFKALKEHYQVHALDTFGVGLSSIGNYSERFTQEEAKHYFVDAVEEWRKAVGIKTFTLVGHSFGGYIATLYCDKYPGHVKRLVLLSPAGTTQKTAQQLQTELENRKQASFGTRMFMCLAEKIYGWNVRPSKVMGSCIFGNKFIEKITSGRLGLKDAQKQAWTKYLKAIAKKQTTSETGFYKLFQWPLKPSKSIQSIINENKFKFPIEFYYGTVDWMDRKGAIRLHKGHENVICETVENAGHQMIFDNPDGVVAKILREDRVDVPENMTKEENQIKDPEEVDSSNHRVLINSQRFKLDPIH